MAIERIAVIGAGFMGRGIAQVVAQAGHDVALVDLDDARLTHAQDEIAWSLKKLVEKGRVPGDAESILAHIDIGKGFDRARDVDLVIEAVYEKVRVKHEVLSELDALCDERTILASNTSTIPIKLLSEVTKRPDRCIGMHFFGPVPLMPLLEIIPSKQTSQETLDAVLAFGKEIGKNTVVVKKDVPGFIMNRIFGAMVCQAVQLVQDGVGTVEDIDRGMCDGFGMRIGPLAIADLAGLDIAYHAFSNMHELDPDHIPKPPELLQKLVENGNFGRKSGQGFYAYGPDGRPTGSAV
jgi:3-hydroxybutyryl-CoA dehydrogenase